MLTIEKLTEAEELVMKCVWDMKKRPTLGDVAERTVEVYGKDWKPQTVSTYLSKLCSKKYLKLHRNGKVYTYETLIKESAYRRKLYRQHISFWNQNDPASFIAEMIKNGDLSEKDITEALNNTQQN